MFRSTHSSAIRRSVLPVIRTAVSLTFLTVLSVALGGAESSTNGLHGASRTPRFTAQTVQTAPAAKKVAVAPKAAAASLLPVVDQDDIQPKHRQLADEVLRALPSFCRAHLQNFYVNYDPKAANRGLGGESTIIIIGTVPDSEFRALLIHECGHVTDLGGLRGTPSSGQSGFYDGNTPIYQNDPSVAFYQISWLTPTVYQPNTKDTDFVSGYAASDPFEDFAEAYAFYALQKTEFQRLAKLNPVIKAKYDFMDKVVFSGNPSVATGRFKRGTRVPWDVTKLPFTWHAKR
jgi:hypothetical protein